MELASVSRPYQFNVIFIMTYKQVLIFIASSKKGTFLISSASDAFAFQICTARVRMVSLSVIKCQFALHTESGPSTTAEVAATTMAKLRRRSENSTNKINGQIFTPGTTQRNGGSRKISNMPESGPI